MNNVMKKLSLLVVSVLLTESLIQSMELASKPVEHTNSNSDTLPAETWQCMVLKGHTKGIHEVAFSPNGKTVLTGSGKDICLWDVKTGELLKVFTGHTKSITSVAFSPDGKLFLQDLGIVQLACGMLKQESNYMNLKHTQIRFYQ